MVLPEEIGEPVWQERRRFPLATVYGVPAALLAVLAVAARPLAAHVVPAVATAA